MHEGSEVRSQMSEVRWEPANIFEKIEAQPPLMRGQAKAAYIGKEVDWALTFADGYEDRSGKVRVMFRSRPHEIEFIAMRVALAEYPWLRSLRRGEPVQVRGRIADVGSTSIELRDARLLQLTEAAR